MRFHPQKAASRPPLQKKCIEYAPLPWENLIGIIIKCIIQQEMYSCRRIQNGVWGGEKSVGRAPPLQSLLTNRFPYSGSTFQVQLLRSLHVYAISEVNAYTPVLVHLIIIPINFSQGSGAYSMLVFLVGGDD